MGISGHILGERKLRRLIRETGLPFERAYNRNGVGQGRIIVGDRCRHYWIDFEGWATREIQEPQHWTSCPPRGVIRIPAPDGIYLTDQLRDAESFGEIIEP